ARSPRFRWPLYGVRRCGKLREVYSPRRGVSWSCGRWTSRLLSGEPPNSPTRPIRSRTPAERATNQSGGGVRAPVRRQYAFCITSMSPSFRDELAFVPADLRSRGGTSMSIETSIPLCEVEFYALCPWSRLRSIPLTWVGVFRRVKRVRDFVGEG